MDYQLLDFGAGRKLERFGPYSIDRPCRAAEGREQGDRRLWQAVDARFERQEGGHSRWRGRLDPSQDWIVRFGPLHLRAKLTPAGQVGIFPEQCDNWSWIVDQCSARDDLPKVLNLFAYTGASTIAAGLAGASVTHVDAAGSMIHWARANADLATPPVTSVRWLRQDVLRFAQREVNRHAEYDGVILDPPSYGHGPRGEAWKVSRDLPILLSLCGQLLSQRSRFVLCTCHSPKFSPRRLADCLGAAIPASLRGTLIGHGLKLETADGRALSAGVCARWSARVDVKTTDLTSRSRDGNSPS